MKKIKSFRVFGAKKGNEKSLELDEISIIADPATLRQIGLFFINSSHEMDQGGAEHIHLQDRVLAFSYENQSDLILINSKKVQFKP